MSIQMIDLSGDVRICVETFGSASDPAIVLAHGASASMLAWDAQLCEQLAARGRYVIRYDQRDTGLSTTYPIGEPGYAQTDLAADVLGIMDALGIEQAHLLGCSMAGGLVTLLGVDSPERLLSLTFMSTTSGDPDLPPMSATFPEQPDDLSSRQVQVDYSVAQLRAFDGGSPDFDEGAVRDSLEADVERSGDLRPGMVNHFIIEFSEPRGGGLSDITLPTLVLQGESDPLFSIEHGDSIARSVPGARLVVLPNQGHILLRPNWDLFVDSLVAHTAR